MTQRPSHNIGARVARYRKMAGLSARELSNKIGGEISRGVIANIESGRKTDVTIDQLIALAWALDVPPVALALPLEEPNRMVAVVASGEVRETVRASSLVDWFTAKRNSSPFSDAAGPGRGYVHAVLRAFDEYRLSGNLVHLRENQFDNGEASQQSVDDARSLHADAARELRDLGIDLADYRVDQ